MTPRTWLALTLSLATASCAVDTTPPPPVGDVGDTSGSELKVACNLSRDSILSSATGARRTAVERGFAWYDAQVSYSQQNQHEGYRTDCSGFVSMCWELGSSYTTANFINDTGEWTSLGSFDELAPADAMVYRSGNSGHIVMFVGWNDASKTEACVLEQASTAEDMQFRARTVDSLVSGGYHAIRATKFDGGSSGPGGGADNPNCQCDAECSQYGDCCSSCSGSGSGGTSGGSGGSPGTGGAASGGSSGGQCYCDAECSQYGDCCADCSGSGSGGSGTGGQPGSGGSGGGQCYCDASCADYGDCCSDCGGSGSGSGGQCYCDAACADYGDCCDYC